MEGYSVEIKECSKELSKKERVMLKDTSSALRLDELTKQSEVELIVDYFAILDIHNDKSEDKDYLNYVVVSKDGKKYITGSNSFFNSFMNIYSEMRDETEPWTLIVYRKESKNRPGKDFISCSLY